MRYLDHKQDRQNQICAGCSAAREGGQEEAAGALQGRCCQVLHLSAHMYHTLPQIVGSMRQAIFALYSLSQCQLSLSPEAHFPSGCKKREVSSARVNLFCTCGSYYGDQRSMHAASCAAERSAARGHSLESRRAQQGELAAAASQQVRLRRRDISLDRPLNGWLYHTETMFMFTTRPLHPLCLEMSSKVCACVQPSNQILGIEALQCLSVA